MSELLLRVHDKVNDTDPNLDAKCTKRGDVIVVCRDGWNWGRDELSLPCYRILCLPHLSEAEASSMLAPQLPSDPSKAAGRLLRRAFHFDLSTLAKAHPDLDAYLADDGRAQVKFTLTGFHAPHFRAVKVKKHHLV